MDGTKWASHGGEESKGKVGGQKRQQNSGQSHKGRNRNRREGKIL